MRWSKIKKTDKNKITILTKEYQNKKGSIITGKIIDEKTKENVSGAIINVYEKQATNQEVLIYLTYSNKQGDFVIETESKGEYILRVSGLGYKEKEEMVNLKNAKQIVVCPIHLTPKDNKTGNNITGQITGENKTPLYLAEVILYRVTKQGEMIPVAYQKTDQEGNYKFTNVPKGTYKVRANMQ